MIHYDLHCSREHAFDGWFKDSAAFEQQARQGFLVCPLCGDDNVSRALMTPALAKPRTAPAAVPEPNPSAPAPSQPVPVAAVNEGQMPDRVRAALRRLRAEVETRCDYVGPGFADEARRIHSGESERRGIYGEATAEQAEMLAEEGIQVARIPWVPRADG